MRFALFSDIHSNYTGLSAVLDAISALGGADVLIAAGDHVAGESGGDDLIDLLLSHHVHLIRGDSDTSDKFRRLAEQARQQPGQTRNSLAYYLGMVEWFDRSLSASNRRLLASLPFELTFDVAPEQRLYVCHASPRAFDDPICAPGTPADTVRQAYDGVTASIAAFGHWHAAYSRWLDGRLYLNVASVGFRQDGRSHFTLLTYHDGHWVSEQHAISYDRETEAKRVRQRGVPRPDP